MTADRLPPAPHPTPHSRRTFLTLAALTAGAPFLGACRGGAGPAPHASGATGPNRLNGSSALGLTSQPGVANW